MGLAGAEEALERPWGGVRGDRQVSKMVKRRSDFYCSASVIGSRAACITVYSSGVLGLSRSGGDKCGDGLHW